MDTLVTSGEHHQPIALSHAEAIQVSGGSGWFVVGGAIGAAAAIVWVVASDNKNDGPLAGAWYKLTS